MKRNNRITPEWIDSLKENEIFVFRRRNSGRHLDGALAFALKHFGAVFGPREGRRGQSYAIPNIGGTVGLREICQSVKDFTQYAAEHPELQFFVTSIGCGGGCRSEQDIAPMFGEAAELPNVSLLQCFWNILKLQDVKHLSLFHRPTTLYEKLMAEYKYGYKEYYWRELCENLLIVSFKHKESPQIYVVNVEQKKVVEMIDKDGYVKIFSQRDIDYNLINAPFVKQLKAGLAPYGICVWGFYKEGFSVVRWGVGKLDRFGCHSHYVDGYIDTDFRVIVPFQQLSDPFNCQMLEWIADQIPRIKDKPSIWR